jgi:hypothetical protein
MKAIYLPEIDPDKKGLNIADYHLANRNMAEIIENLIEFKSFDIQFVHFGIIHIKSFHNTKVGARISMDGSIIIAQNLTQAEYLALRKTIKEYEQDSQLRFNLIKQQF